MGELRRRCVNSQLLIHSISYFHKKFKAFFAIVGILFIKFVIFSDRQAYEGSDPRERILSEWLISFKSRPNASAVDKRRLEVFTQG